MSRYFIGGTTATRAIACLGACAFTFARTAAHAMTGSAHDPFKIFGTAVRAFELYLILLFHYQNFEAIITFQASELIQWHLFSLFKHNYRSTLSGLYRRNHLFWQLFDYSIETDGSQRQ
jgi:hypothetical protein